MADEFSMIINTLESILVPMRAFIDSLPPDPDLAQALEDFNNDLQSAKNLDPTSEEEVTAARAQLAVSRTRLFSMLSQ
jgi:hypothetical protein